MSKARAGEEAAEASSEGSPVAPEGRREAAKAERRQRIINATRELIRETGEAGLSMRALAARAGVSLATPYNLFGSKGAIVVAALDDIRHYQSSLAKFQSMDPVERLFNAVDVAASFYQQDPTFHRVVWRAMFNGAGEVRAALSTHIRIFWRKLAVDVVDAGVVRLDAEVLCRQLERIYQAVVMSWILDDVRDEQFSPEIQLGFALLLNGAASPDWRGPLTVRVRECEARLARA